MSVLVVLLLMITEHYKEKTLPELEDFLKMRTIKDSSACRAFYFMADNFLKHVAGKKKWKKKKALSTVTNEMTVSDEAFVYLVLCNYWENWEDFSEGMPEADRWPAKFTKRRTAHRKHQGWSKDGFKKYNELHRLVQKDRQTTEGAEMEEEFSAKKEEEEKEGMNAKKRKRMNKEEEEQVAPVIESFEDMANDSIVEKGIGQVGVENARNNTAV